MSAEKLIPLASELIVENVRTVEMKLEEYDNEVKLQTSDLVTDLTENEKKYYAYIFGEHNRVKDSLVDKYRILFPKRVKADHEKTNDEVRNEIYNANMDVDFDESLKESIAVLQQELNKNKELQERILRLPDFIDFAYYGFIKFFAKDYPISGLPSSVDKLKKTAVILGIEEQPLIKVFEKIIKEELLTDMCQLPPYYLRTNMTAEDIENYFDMGIKPLFKDVLEGILRLCRTDVSVAEPNVDKILQNVMSEVKETIEEIVVE